MRNHPLTPMTDANLIRLMDAQSTRKSGLVPFETVRQGAGAVKARMDELAAQGTPWLVCDAVSDADLRTIGTACAGHALVTGGSGVARGLGVNFGIGADGPVPPAPVAAPGFSLVLAGSCSQATQGQVERFTQQRPGFALDPLALAENRDGYVAEAIVFARRHCPDGPCIVYSTASPDRVAATQARFGREAAGAMLERALADIAAALVETGVRRILVAGGETSGAVVSRLGVRALRIGETIAPGVPWTETLLDPANPAAPHLALALKSGNFGGEDFFMQALGLLANAD